MCQAFEAESRLMSAMEDSAAQVGFEDYLDKKPFSTQRNLSLITNKSYLHGWECARQGILPYGVERALRLDGYDKKFVCPVCKEEVARYSRRQKRRHARLRLSLRRQ